MKIILTKCSGGGAAWPSALTHFAGSKSRAYSKRVVAPSAIVCPVILAPSPPGQGLIVQSVWQSFPLAPSLRLPLYRIVSTNIVFWCPTRLRVKPRRGRAGSQLILNWLLISAHAWQDTVQRSSITLHFSLVVLSPRTKRCWIIMRHMVLLLCFIGASVACFYFLSCFGFFVHR